MDIRACAIPGAFREAFPAAPSVLLRTKPFFMEFLTFLHSLLRYGVIVMVAVAGFVALRGYLARSPILNWERSAAILAMVLCHVQLAIGLVLYFANGWYRADSSTSLGRFWKMEHIATMILAVALITLGRSLSKRAKEERTKQLHVAVFYLIGLVLILAMIPWPFMTRFANTYQWL